MSNRWVVVTRTEGALEAEILRGLLEANGIPVVISQEGAASAIGLSVGPLALVDILVPREHQESAQNLLEDYHNGRLSAADEAQG